MVSSKSSFKKIVKIPISVGIIAAILLQAYLGVFRFCSRYHSSFFIFKFICPEVPNDPAFYPFLDYPMYAGSRPEGVQVNRYIAIGILEDSTEFEISPEILDLTRYKFFRNFINDLIENKTQNIKIYFERYNTSHSQKLIRIRLENHPIKLSREGTILMNKKIINQVNVN